jgi:L-histidine Nalpha-methyltransferase
MWLRSTSDQQITVADLGLELDFRSGEEMLTEISAKFTPGRLEAELQASGFSAEALWTSDGDEFLVTLARPS